MGLVLSRNNPKGVGGKELQAESPESRVQSPEFRVLILPAERSVPARREATGCRSRFRCPACRRDWTSGGFEDALGPGLIDRGFAIGYVELHEDRRHMVLDGSLGDEEFVCDLDVCETTAEERENLSLSRS